MRAPVLLVTLALAAPLLAPPAGAVLSLLPAEPCDAPDFIRPGEFVPAPGGQWLRVTFRADAPVSGTFWGEVGFRVATTAQVGLGYAAERAVSGAFLEDAAGNLLAVNGLAMYPYGVQADLPGQVVRLAAGDLAGCGGGASGSPVDLAPGTYRAVSLGATETGAGHALVLPPGVAVVAVETGPLTLLTESSYACTLNVRVEAAGFASEVLEGCSTPYAAQGTAYRALAVGAFPDQNHQVRWLRPDGARQNVVFGDFDRGAPGTWTLEIPRYVTPLGQPFFFPGPIRSEGGVFGAFADLPPAS